MFWTHIVLSTKRAVRMCFAGGGDSFCRNFQTGKGGTYMRTLFCQKRSANNLVATEQDTVVVRFAANGQDTQWFSSMSAGEGIRTPEPLRDQITHRGLESGAFNLAWLPPHQLICRAFLSVPGEALGEVLREERGEAGIVQQARQPWGSHYSVTLL